MIATMITTPFTCSPSFFANHELLFLLVKTILLLLLSAILSIARHSPTITPKINIKAIMIKTTTQTASDILPLFSF